MYKIVIDPGHGGESRSNRGPTGYIEADGVLAISKYLKAELVATGQFDVLMTRETDMTIGLVARGQIAVDYKADLFISEHTNAVGSPTKVRGTIVYYSVDIPSDKDLAFTVAKNVSEALGIPNRGAKVWESTKYPDEDYLTVIDTAQDGGVRHVLLVESAFHDHPEDEALLKVDANLKKIAKAQAKAICGFFKVTYPKPTPPVINKPILKQGMYHSPAVVTLQRNLKTLGYTIVVDGDFGPATKAVVIKFQKDNGLTQDGIVGPKTWAKIDSLLAK